jgi:cell division septation protein DedD
MQDIDFSRYYRRQRRPHSGQESSDLKGKGGPVNKLSLYLAIAFSSLAIGFIGGTQLQKNKMIRDLEGKIVPESIATANVSSAPSAEVAPAAESVRVTRPEQAEGSDAKPAHTGSYLILAKIFADEKEASLAGLNLKRNGHKAFMARNGKKVKLYVGPIANKSEAYESLAKLKKSQDFSGAILYRK